AGHSVILRAAQRLDQQAWMVHDNIAGHFRPANAGQWGHAMETCAVILLLAASAAADVERDQVPLVAGTAAAFASPDEGREIVATDDAFTASLSRFDLQCRLKTDKEVTLA